MIYSIKGKIIERSPVHVVIDTGGLAYTLSITLTTSEKLNRSDEANLYVHLHINGNDFSPTLYGFFHDDEREMFRKLISVSGVGPNTARMILSSLTTEELSRVIMMRDVGSLKRIKGIGEKTAERMIVDLHDKINKNAIPYTEKIGGGYNTLKMDALTALSSLGLDKTKTEKLLDKLLAQGTQDLSLEELIKQVLKQI
jgi:Holliday junction DNA helicase RuvA